MPAIVVDTRVDPWVFDPMGCTVVTKRSSRAVLEGCSLKVTLLARVAA